MNREYPDRPIVGVGAVIFVDQAILLVRRNQEPGRGEWSLPGGVVELGETLSEALKRELREEVSIGIRIGGLISVFDRLVRDQENRVQYHYILVDYWGWMTSGRPHPGSDVSEVQLVGPGQLDSFEIGGELKDTIWTAADMRKRNLHA
jgi:ADP-ribose pyrophosphatase YjhB (NUDIX family)